MYIGSIVTINDPYNFYYGKSGVVIGETYVDSKTIFNVQVSNTNVYTQIIKENTKVEA